VVASPDIAARAVIVWLGGNRTWWTPAGQYNAVQDRHASRVLFDSGVPLVHVPCLQMTEKVDTAGGPQLLLLPMSARRSQDASSAAALGEPAMMSLS
jgi:hypothetical protein